MRENSGGNPMDDRLGAVFVHGFNSTAAVWDPYVNLIENDPDLAFVTTFKFTYDTRLWQPDPRLQIPSLDTTADELMEYLESATGDYERLALVAHSMGGLVVQRYLFRMLGLRRRGQELSRRVRRVILFACPNNGAEFGMALRRTFLRSNPQESELRPFNEQITDTLAFVINNVVHAEAVSESSCPIPMIVYAGATDNIVRPASARSVFPDAAVLPGDHSTIVKPDSHEHRAYYALKKQLQAAAEGGPRGPDKALDEYREEVKKRYGYLELAGIPVESDNLALGHIPLGDVYVQLQALPEIGRTQEGPVAVSTDAETSRQPHEAVKKTVKKLWEQARSDKRPQEHWGSIPPEEAVQKGPRSVVILGAPGAGKSTMMRMLATRLATSNGPVPVYVQLSAIELTESLSLREAALNYAVRLFQDKKDRDRVKTALEEAIAKNHVCFLFDGLDEVHSQKEKIWEELRAMSQAVPHSENLPPGARIVVTSRPSGYMPLPAAHFRILPLLPKDSRTFIEKWFRVLAHMRDPARGSTDDWVRDNTAWLIDQLEARPQLRDIASNPLMLTFLALNAGENPKGKLPEHRKDLYRSYVERLFAGWESRRKREGSLTPGGLDGGSLQNLYTWFIYQVAWRVHQGYYGTAPSDSPTEHRLVAILKDDLKNFKDVDHRSGSFVKDGLSFWMTAGLLRKTETIKGHEWYLFRHQTFQEYGAARALAERYSKYPDGAWAELEQYLSDPAWGEVIPLTLGCLAEFGHEADAVIMTLIKRKEIADNSTDQPNETDGLYLAARCVSDGANVDSKTLNELLAQLSQRASAGKDEAFSALASIGWSRPDEVLARLAEINESGKGDDGRIRLRVTEARGKMQPRSTAFQWLSELARDGNLEPDYRVTAAWASGRLGYKEEAVEFICNIQKSAKSTDLMVEALRELGTVEGNVVLRNIGVDCQASPYRRKGIAEYFIAINESILADEVLTSIIDDPNLRNPRVSISAVRERAKIRGTIRS
jgi:pimeloyl-ACP methyl ester carboxylesterase